MTLAIGKEALKSGTQSFEANPLTRPDHTPLPSQISGRPFLKMNGLGNDFVVIDAREAPFVLDAASARRITDRKRGIGCDQLILLEKSARADVFMRILNADGGEVEACGNAARCVARLMMDEKGNSHTSIETRVDLLTADDGGTVASGLRPVAVNMGKPRFGWQDIPLSIAVDDTRHVPIDSAYLEAGLPTEFVAVNVGNPHAIFVVADVNAHAIERTGPILETHPHFPARVNVSFVSVASRHHIIQRVWERGAGLTLACGTGACAAAVAVMRLGLTERTITVTLPGGDLTIEWRADDHIIMTGPVTLAFTGTIAPSLLVDAA
jgi:diaminopimelate epimerase